jgi:uncharacterized membrane protein YdjX (TVP38/TMEM64 family)
MTRRFRPGGKIIKPLAGILLIGSAIWAYTTYDLTGLFSLDRITALVNSLGALGPMAFIGLCIAGVFLHMPEFVLIAVGGVLFGGVKGCIYGWIGALAGSTSTFLCVRYCMRDTVQKTLDGKFKRLDALDSRLAEQGFQTVLMLRLVLFMAPPLNWLIALTRVKFSHYFAASAIGIIPGVAVTCYSANTIARAKSLADVFTLEFALPFFLLVTLVLGSTLAARRLLGRRQAA